MHPIDLPPPISTNNLFANIGGKGRVRSGAYNTWIKHADAMLQEQKLRRTLPAFDGPVLVSFAVGTRRGERAISSRLDIDNTFKAYIDRLVHWGVIEDDNRRVIRGVLGIWADGQDGTTAYVRAAEDAWQHIGDIVRPMVKGAVS